MSIIIAGCYGSLNGLATCNVNLLGSDVQPQYEMMEIPLAMPGYFLKEVSWD